MPPLEKRYDEPAGPLQVLTDKATRARIRRLKDHGAAPSQAAVVRDILDVGLPMMETLWGLDDGFSPVDPADAPRDEA
mgnify:CR=1 FL=1